MNTGGEGTVIGSVRVYSFWCRLGQGFGGIGVTWFEFSNFGGLATFWDLPSERLMVGSECQGKGPGLVSLADVWKT